MFRQDMIQRAIEQLAQAIARAVGLTSRDQHAEALECLQQAKDALPIVPGLVDHMSGAALLSLLGREQAQLLAQLLATEADVLEQMGHLPLAQARRKRSRDLRRLVTTMEQA